MSFFASTVKSESTPAAAAVNPLNLTATATSLKQEATNANTSTAAATSTTAAATSTTSATGLLPNILSFSVPSLTPLKATEADKKNTSLLSGANTTAGATTDSSGVISASAGKNLALNPGSTIYSSLRPQSVKDQNLPAPLMECVENFKLVK
jgi:hypothetical protein